MADNDRENLGLPTNLAPFRSIAGDSMGTDRMMPSKSAKKGSSG